MMSLHTTGAAHKRSLLADIEELVTRRLSQVQSRRIVNLPLVIGARGVPLAAGDHVFLRLGLDATVDIVSWSIAATVAGASHAGTCQLDVQVGATLAAAASICGFVRPSLTAAAERDEQAPTGWATSIADPSWLKAVVISADGTLEVVSLTLRLAGAG